MQREPGADLKDKDQGQAVAEFRLALFVAKDDHSGDTAEGAS